MQRDQKRRHKPPWRKSRRRKTGSFWRRSITYEGDRSGLPDVLWFGCGGEAMTDEDWESDDAHALGIFLNGDEIPTHDRDGNRGRVSIRHRTRRRPGRQLALDAHPATRLTEGHAGAWGWPTVTTQRLRLRGSGTCPASVK